MTRRPRTKLATSRLSKSFDPGKEDAELEACSSPVDGECDIGDAGAPTRTSS